MKQVAGTVYESNDIGNGNIKAVADDGRTIDKHALVPLSNTEYQHILTRQLKQKGLFVVNGQPYLFGSAAVSAMMGDPPAATDRYRADYVGVISAIQSALLHRAHVNVTKVALFPPGDQEYARYLQEAIIADGWQVHDEFVGATYNITVKRVIPLDEPLGTIGLLRFQPTGALMRGERAERIRNGNTLVIDVGEWSTDAQSIINGRPDYELSKTLDNRGARRLRSNVWKAIKEAHPDETIGVHNLLPNIIDNAITTGVLLMGGADPLDVKEQVDEVKMTMARGMRPEFSAMEPRNYDTIIWTGGGSQWFFPLADHFVKHNNQIMAAEGDNLLFANADGALRVLKAILKAS